MFQRDSANCERFSKKNFGFPKGFPKAVIKRAKSDTRINSFEREQARPKVRALFTACVDSNLDGRMSRILT